MVQNSTADLAAWTPFWLTTSCCVVRTRLDVIHIVPAIVLSVVVCASAHVHVVVARASVNNPRIILFQFLESFFDLFQQSCVRDDVVCTKYRQYLVKRGQVVFSLTRLAFGKCGNGFPNALCRFRGIRRADVLEKRLQSCTLFLAPFEIWPDLFPDGVVGSALCFGVCVFKKLDYRRQVLGHFSDPRWRFALRSFVYFDRELDEIDRSGDEAEDRGGFAHSSHRVAGDGPLDVELTVSAMSKTSAILRLDDRRMFGCD